MNQLQVCLEIFAASRPQTGRSLDEDAFLILRGEIPAAAVADGAGAAEDAARRVLSLFEKLFREVLPPKASERETWKNWVRLLDSSLLNAAQSTFLGNSVLDGMVIAECVGDSRA